MRHSIKDKTNGRFIKQITVNQDRPVKPVPVVQIVMALIVIGSIIIALDKFKIIHLF